MLHLPYPARFAELYENNFEPVYAYIARRVHDREEAQDLTAEVFHQALAGPPRFGWRGLPFVAWLTHSPRHVVLNHTTLEIAGKVTVLWSIFRGYGRA